MNHRMSGKNLARLLTIALFLLGMLAVLPPARQAQQSPGETGFEKTVLPFLAENCLACHNGKRASGGLNLEQYKTAASVAQDRDRWGIVLTKLRTGERPPKGIPARAEAKWNLVISWPEGELTRASGNARPDPG